MAPSGEEPDWPPGDFDEYENDAPRPVAAQAPPGYRRRVGVAVGVVMLGVILLAFGIITLTTGDDPLSSAGQETTMVSLVPPDAAGTTPAAPAPVTTAGPESPSMLPVTVLNNSSLTGLASKVAGELEAGGWPIAELLNYSETQVPATTVFFTPGNAAEEAAAQALVVQFPEITGGAEPRFEGLDGAGLTVAAVGDWVPGD